MDEKECKLPFERIKRDILIRKKAKTSPNFGKDPYKRDIKENIGYGIININKPKGPTSHQVSSYIKDILKLDKCGHSGTLDPKVTGVLPTATGRATRIVQTLLNAGKEYICVMHIHKEVNEEELRKVIGSFVGKIKQLPPIKSAVKRQERYRKIYYLHVYEIIEKDVLFKVGCQAGTYIRKLCHDIGKKLGVGAHMAELIRTKAGPFNSESMVTIQDLEDSLYYFNKEGNEKYVRNVILPLEQAVTHLPKVWVLDSAVNSLCHGTDVGVPGISKVESDIQLDETIAVMTLKEELVCLGKARMISKDIQKKEKGIAIKVEKVFMLPGTYPKKRKE